LSRTRQKLLLLGMLGLLAVTATAVPIPSEPTVDGLKARISSASAGEKPRLCVQVAQMRLKEADKLYAAGDLDNAQAALTDVVAYSELARDYSIQSHKYQKQSEIAVRHMTRKLTDLLHTLAQPEQGAIKDAVARLSRVSDDLLASMFSKGQK
jgi:muramidase (phage lysozyme)